MDWLDHHLETFVRPYLGLIPKPDVVHDFIFHQWPPHQVQALFKVWAQCKVLAERRTILLAGRDVFLLELLARLDGYPTLFRSDISSAVARSEIIPVGHYGTNYHLIDTGYSGTIPKLLGMVHWHLIRYSGACDQYQRDLHQVFPKASFADDLTLMGNQLEGTPKYWTRGEVDYGGKKFGDKDRKPLRTLQNLAGPAEFTRAAILAQHVGHAYRLYRYRKHPISMGRGI